MAEGERLAKAYVEIEADVTKVDQGMNKLPEKVSKKILELQRTTQAQLARNKLEMKVAVNAGDFKAIDQLNAAQERLRVTMEKVNRAAMNQAAAMRGVSSGGAAGGGVPGGGKGGKSGGGGAFGGNAMGLLMISQFVDDAQYGFKALVNQIPQVGMALGSALGMGTEAAMKFGGAIGIAGVAVNLLINHWDDLMDAMELGKVYTEAEAMEKLAAATKLTADEQERLNRFKKAQAAGQELGGKQASGVAKTEGEVKAAIGEMGDERTSGRSKLVSGLVQARRASGHGTKMTDEEKGRLEGWKREYGGTSYGKFGYDREKAKIQERLDKEDVERAGDTVDKSTFDSQRRQGLINEINANPNAFPKGAAAALDVKPAKNTKDQEAADLAKKQSEGIDEDNRKSHDAWKKMQDDLREKEANRLAGALGSSVGGDIISGKITEADGLESRVKEALEKAGVSAEKIGDLTKIVADKLAAEAGKDIEQRALNKGISFEDAQKQLAKEDQDKKDKEAGKGMTKAGVVSNDSYLKTLMVAGVSKPKEEQLASQQLAEQKTGNKFLDQILKAVADADQRTQQATFARGRS